MRWRIPVLLLALALGGCSWVTNYFRGADNTEPPTPLKEFKPTLKVQKLWSTDLGNGSEEQLLRLKPAVSGDTVFAADRKGKIRAVSLKDGSRSWQVEAKAPVSAGPGYGDGLVLVGTTDARVLAFHGADGKPAWQAQVSSEVLSVPKAADGVVVVRTVDGRVTGLSAKDGKRLWVYDGSEPILSLRGTSSPVIDGRTVVAGLDSGHLVALSLNSGNLLWNRAIAIPHGRSELERLVDIDGDPVIRGGTIYVVTYQGRVAALTLDGGRLLWSQDMSSFAGLAVGPVRLFVTDDHGRVWALDRSNGASVWRQNQLAWRGVTGPVVMGGAVVVGDAEGYLHWLSASDGQFLARIRVGSEGFTSAPVLAGKTLLTFGKDGTLSAFAVGG
jgi:outer membrane protein assembly factor BamB